MPFLGSPTPNHIRQIAHLPQTIPTFVNTNSSLYSDPVGIRVIVRKLDRSADYYTYESLNPTTPNGLIYANVNLGINQHGTFDIQIENFDSNLDTSTITSGARVYIDIGKSTTNYTRVLSGMIRSHGHSVGCENNNLYNISGFGTGIRMNERIIELNDAPDKTIFDSITIDTNDSDFKADHLFDDLFDRTSYYPEDVTSNVREGTGGFGHLDTANVIEDSEISDFIPGMVSRFDEIIDPVNQIEEYTLARAYIDVDDRPRLEAFTTPHSANYGFRITNTPDYDNDSADNTMYMLAECEYHDFISKDFSYSNKLYGILPADPVFPVDYFADVGSYYENKTVEIAQRFRPVTNPNWEFVAAVEAVGISNTDGSGAVRMRWRIAQDDNGIPMNTGGIVANHFEDHIEHYNTSDGGIQTIHVFGTGDTDLDENKYYWLILSSVNSTVTQYWRWHGTLTGAGGITATAAPATSSNTDGGTGWVTFNGAIMFCAMRRFKAEPFAIVDQKGVDTRIEIDSRLPSFPAQIQNKLAANKFLVSKMAMTAIPRRVYSFPRLTIPNKMILPGDIATIQHDGLDLSTTGNHVSYGQISDINYTFGIRNGGLSTESTGPTSMSLTVIGDATYY